MASRDLLRRAAVPAVLLFSLTVVSKMIVSWLTSARSIEASGIASTSRYFASITAGQTTMSNCSAS